jgi:hypothetical protein
MAVESRATIESYFEPGDKPVAEHFKKWLAAFFHLDEDTIPISKVENLQTALNGLAPKDIPVSYPFVDTGNDLIIVGDITADYLVMIEYLLIRGVLIERGSIELTNKADAMINQNMRFDDCGFVFSKSVTDNNINLIWTDTLQNGIAGTFIILKQQNIKIS